MAIKKKFFDIEIPLINQIVPVLGVSQDSVVGRFIKFDLTKILKGKNVDATILIEKKDDKLYGTLLKLLIVPSYIRRMMRKGVSYVEDSFIYEGFVVKPFMLTRKKVHKSVRTKLAKQTREFLFAYLKGKKKEEVFQDVLSGKLQKSLSLHLKKIYPLAFCEIREISLKQ